MATGRSFTVAQAAEYLKCSAVSIRRWAQRGYIECFRDMLSPGGPYRFSQEALDTFRRTRQQPIELVPTATYDRATGELRPV